MPITISSAEPHTFADAPKRATTRVSGAPRPHRVRAWGRVAVSLLAVYGPVILAVLLLHGSVTAKAYLVLSAWAIEAILWYRLGDPAHSRRSGEWRAEPL